MLVDDGNPNVLYKDHMFAPFTWAHYLFEPIFSLRPFDLCMGVVLVVASMRKMVKGPTVRPMRRALFVAGGAMAIALVYGLSRGGDGRAAGWQVYLLFATILLSFTLASIFQTAEHFLGVVRTIVAAGFYHATMGILFWAFYVKQGAIKPFPEYLTTHDDTVLWTVGVGFLLLQALQTKVRRTRILSILGMVFLLVAIQLNHRRLAWISLGGSLLALYFLIPPSVIKKRINRVVMVVAPILLLYVFIGMDRPEGIFRPLQAFTSVSSAKDNSTKARIVENLGLIATSNFHGWFMGSGFGHKYIEISNRYNIYGFELWPYVPHNSVLGMLAYSGFFGFVGYWMTFPTAVFLHARTARFGATQADRFMGVVGVMQMVACADQWFGDMGSFSSITDYTLAISFGAALRVPIIAGAWSEKGAPAKAKATGATETEVVT
jgi:hypothetical protein